MGCGGCGHNRSIKIDRHIPNTIHKKSAKLPKCDICGSIMRELHVFNEKMQRIVKVFYCSKDGCTNSKSRKEI